MTFQSGWLLVKCSFNGLGNGLGGFNKQRYNTIMATTKRLVIYGICDEHGEVRYVGKTNDVHQRFKTHLAEKVRTYPLYTWLRKQIREGKEVSCKVLSSVIGDWRQLERDMIAQYRADSPRMLNLADGGDEPFCSLEVRQKIGASIKCPVEVRQANGRKVSAAIQADPVRKRIHYLKLHLSRALNMGCLQEEVKTKLRYAAAKRPDLFGIWSNI